VSNATEVITVEPETKDKLRSLKLYKKETWNEVIKRLIENVKDDPLVK